MSGDRMFNWMLAILCVMGVLVFALRIFTVARWGFDPLTEARP